MLRGWIGEVYRSGTQRPNGQRRRQVRTGLDPKLVAKQLSANVVRLACISVAAKAHADRDEGSLCNLIVRIDLHPAPRELGRSFAVAGSDRVLDAFHQDLRPEPAHLLPRPTQPDLERFLSNVEPGAEFVAAKTGDRLQVRDRDVDSHPLKREDIDLDALAVKLDGSPTRIQKGCDLIDAVQAHQALAQGVPRARAVPVAP
jgi:hypothetical protein